MSKINKDCYSDELKDFLANDCMQICKEKQHKYLNSAHIFVALNRFLFNMSDAGIYRIKFYNGETRFITIFGLSKVSDETLKPRVQDGTWHLGGIDLGVPSTEDIISGGFVSTGTNDPFYSEVANAYHSLLVSYDLSSDVVGGAFKFLFPIGEEKPENVDVCADVKTIFEQLSKQYEELGIKMNILDLMLALFTKYDDYGLSSFISLLRQIEIDHKQLKPNAPKFDGAKFCSEVAKIVKDFESKQKVSKTKIKKNKDKLTSLEKNEYLKNLNKKVMNDYHPLFDVDDVINALYINLSKRTTHNAALIGPSGCGKTAIVRELAYRLATENCPERFKGYVIYELSLPELVAGCQLRGQFEQRARNIFNELAKVDNAILFIDEGHTILTVGSSSSGDGESAGNIIKPYLSNGEIKCILATTDNEYKYIEEDPAFKSRFGTVRMVEPSDEKVKLILQSLIDVNEEFFGREIEEKLIDDIIKIGPKYIPNEGNPRRSIKLLESSFAYASILKEEGKPVDVKDLTDYLALQYNYVISDNKADDTYKEMTDKILGQEKALTRIHENLTICEAGFIRPNKPMLSMILTGPTGTGKTESSKLIAKYFFGSEKNIININMSEYSTKESQSNLIGTSRGYVGYEDETKLIKGIKNNPNSVVLFDEIEKGDPGVFDVFLKILDEGEITDNKGNPISFRNAIIIFTTNLGFDHNSNDETGAGLVKTVSGTSNVKAALKKKFKPEFLARINDIITYDYLKSDIVETLVDRIRKEYIQEAISNGTELPDIQFTEEDIKRIVKLADVEHQGARHIDDAVRRVLVTKYLELRKMNA